MTSTQLPMAVIAGFAAGCINTLSGNGSILTLGFMTEVLGMPAQLANGTNRIGLFMQGVASLEAFRRNQKFQKLHSRAGIIIGIAGALLGALTSIYLDASSFYKIYRTLMLAMLFIAILRPERWLKINLEFKNLPHYIVWPTFFILGFYGGFIQMGMGIFFLFLMVNIFKTPIVEANIMKLILVTSYTLLVIIIFNHYQLMDWRTGCVIAFGQAAGGWMMAQWASKVPNVERWGYALFVGAIALTVLKLFGWLHF